MPTDIRQYIKELSASTTQPAFIMIRSYRIIQGFMLACITKIYYLRQAIRREEMDGRSPIKTCLHLATKHIYATWMDMDSDGSLTLLLIKNPKAIQFIRIWPYVVLIDTTYKNKQHEMTAMWYFWYNPNKLQLLGCILLDEG